MNRNEKIEQLKSLSHLLDTKFQGPLGFRFGLDGLIGLIPGGDFVTAGVSLYIIAQAAALGVGPSTLVRMALNVALENIVDLVPVLGTLFDFYYKANQRNILLLQNHLDNPVHETIKSRTIVALIGVTLLALLILTAYLSFKLLQFVVVFFSSLLEN